MKRAKIMVVEDEGIVAADIQDRLRALGYGVAAVVESGEEAERTAGSSRPDLVLMDIFLKGDIDGVEAAERIRTNWDIPVVFLTAHADETTLQRAKITAPFGYILKPFNDRELHTTVEIALFRHAIEAKLKNTERWLSAVLESIGDAVVATDKWGLITLMNTSAAVFTGWDPGEAFGKPLAEVFPLLDEVTRLPVMSPVSKIMYEETDINWCNPLLLLSRKGAERLVDYTAAPIRDDQSNITGIVWVFRDITKRRQAEADRLILSNLESTGILAGGIAHDFNNLLTVILLNLELAQTLIRPDDELAHLLEQAMQAAFASRGLSQQLITFAQGGAPIRKPTRLSGVIQESVRPAVSGSRVRCEFFLAEDLWLAEVDAGQIGQVIRNLVLNAREAMPQGGVVSVRAENVVLGSHENPSLPPGDYVRVSIADRGGGIAKEVLPKIFDPYFSTKQRGDQKGMGLGLTICHTVIQKHGGAIAVESEVGVGTTFHIHLPAFRKRLGEEKASVPEVLPRQGRILVMDDEEGVREVVGVLLQRMGHEVEMVEDGQRAVEVYGSAKGQGRPFDAVILDLTVRAGVGGQEAILALLKIDPAVKAIVMSGYANDPVVLEPERCEFKGALVKPFAIGELQEMVSRVMGS
jgi:PAS domain S-box-containing protein